MLDGKIVFKSTYGVGTEFKFAIKISNNDSETKLVRKIKGANTDRTLY